MILKSEEMSLEQISTGQQAWDGLLSILSLLETYYIHAHISIVHSFIMQYIKIVLDSLKHHHSQNKTKKYSSLVTFE